MSLSRRRLLAGLTGVGALGSIAGVGTAAFLNDRESLTNELRATELQLGLSTDDADEQVALTFLDLEYGGSQTQTVCIGLEEGPGWIWIRLCGDVDGELAGLLTADLVVRDEETGETIFSAAGTLAEVAEALNATQGAVDSGTPLFDEDPYEVGDVACVALTLTLPVNDGTTGRDQQQREYLRSGPSLALELQVLAEQSNNNETDPESAWTDSCTGTPGGGPQ
jgi:hypothetical protein